MTLDNGTDGQTDRRTDSVQRNMRPPPREEGRIINCCVSQLFPVTLLLCVCVFTFRICNSRVSMYLYIMLFRYCLYGAIDNK